MLLKVPRARRAATQLTWSARPYRGRCSLGVRKVWRTSCRRYEVHTYSEGIGDFAVVYRSAESLSLRFTPAPFDHKRTLQAAKRAADQHARAAEGDG